MNCTECQLHETIKEEIRELRKKQEILQMVLQESGQRISILETRIEFDNDVLEERVAKLESQSKKLEDKMLEILIVADSFKRNVEQLGKANESLDNTQKTLQDQVHKIRRTISFAIGGGTVVAFILSKVFDFFL